MLDWQMQIGSVLMGPTTSYIVTGVDGFGQGAVRVGDLARPQVSGTYYGTDTYDARSLTIDITISGQGSAAQCMANYDALMAAWQLPYGADTTTLTFQVPGRQTLAMIGRPRKVAVTDSFASLKSGFIVLTLEFYSAFYQVFGSAVTPYTVSPASATTGRSYNRTYSYNYGGSASGNALVPNNGTTPYWPTVVINGPCTNPFVQNVTTGQTLSFQTVLGGSDVLTVDMDARTVLLNGTASRTNAVLVGSQFWPLLAGNNNILFNATAAGGATAVVQARDAYLG